MNKEKLLEIAAHLRKLGNKEIEPIEPSLGICSNVRVNFHCIGYSGNFFEELGVDITRWEHFSGNQYYPLPGGSIAYLLGGKWEDPLRLELCIWLAEQIEENVKDG